MKGPTYTRFIDNRLDFYYKDPLKGIKHMHKWTFLREVTKPLYELKSRVLGFGSHNDIHPYMSPHLRVQATRIVRVVSDNNQIFLTRFEWNVDRGIMIIIGYIGTEVLNVYKDVVNAVVMQKKQKDN